MEPEVDLHKMITKDKYVHLVVIFLLVSPSAEQGLKREVQRYRTILSTQERGRENSGFALTPKPRMICNKIIISIYSLKVEREGFTALIMLSSVSGKPNGETNIV